MISHMTTGAQSTLRILVRDLAWCWWTQPRATRIGDCVFFGGIASDGSVVAVAYDARTGSVQQTTIARLERDDHNNPAIVAAHGKPLIAFYSRHDADDALRYRIGTRAADVSGWREEQRLSFGGITTYAQAHVLGNEVHVLTRVGDTAWGYARSDDWGENWHEPLSLLAIETDQETYMPTALLRDGRSVRIAVAGHPKNYKAQPWHQIRACVLDLASGTITRPTDGVVLANVRERDGLPVRGEQLELVYEAPEGRTVNLFDVADGERFEIAFASKVADDGSTRDARYHVAHAAGGTWHVEDLVAAGRTFGYIDAGFYVGGIAFPYESPGGRVYVSRESERLWYLERWVRASAGAWSADAGFDPSAERIVRPWPVRNPLPGLEVVALELERYGDDYMETLSHLVGGAFGDDSVEA